MAGGALFHMFISKEEKLPPSPLAMERKEFWREPWQLKPASFSLVWARKRKREGERPSSKTEMEGGKNGGRRKEK